MGEWSPECYRCEWLDGATAAAVGVRFRGYNRLGRYRWERTAIVTAAERGRELSFATLDERTGRRETQWQYTILSRHNLGRYSPNRFTSCGARP